MYVRAPKHFKSGKQHIFFFRGSMLSKQKLTSTQPFSLVHSLKSQSVFSLVSSSMNKSLYNDLLISRVTTRQPVLLKII